jgi:hypothetical protein
MRKLWTDLVLVMMIKDEVRWICSAASFVVSDRHHHGNCLETATDDANLVLTLSLLLGFFGLWPSWPPLPRGNKWSLDHVEVRSTCLRGYMSEL